MSTAAATAVEAPPPAKGKKKLIVIVAAVAVVLLVLAGGAAWLLMKQSAAARAEAEGDAAAPAHVEAREAKAVPAFVALDAFTVNLADRDAERYAQIGITLEIDEAKTAERIKAFMPAIRNNVLMAIADRTAGELLGREGKALLAERIAREASRAMGYAVPADDATAADDKPAPRKRHDADALPIRAVHFSNFIVQ